MGSTELVANLFRILQTEKIFLKSKESEMNLSSEQIGSKLAIISRKGLTDGVQANLISMV